MNSPTLLSLPDSVDKEWDDKSYPMFIILDIAAAIDAFHEACANMTEIDCSIDLTINEILEYISIEESAEDGLVALSEDLRRCFHSENNNDGEIIAEATLALGKAILQHLKNYKLYTTDGILPPYELDTWVDSETPCLVNVIKDQRQKKEKEEMAAMNESFRTTLGNEEWMKANTEALKKLLPETWTHVSNLNGLQIGFNFKLLGIDWRSELEFGKVMVFLEKIGLMQRDGVLVRGNHQYVFDNTVLG